ncbi:MAG: hypothetical protein IJZ13_02390, partial [Clostridia bacterium]|nr:hypothetical protein [Clostridia bacterium]
LCCIMKNHALNAWFAETYGSEQISMKQRLRQASPCQGRWIFVKQKDRGGENGKGLLLPFSPVSLANARQQPKVYIRLAKSWIWSHIHPSEVGSFLCLMLVEAAS